MSGWRGWVHRVRVLLFRRREEREMDEEMRFHLEMETRKLVERGMEPAAARREAYRSFGGVERMKERTRDERGTRGLEEIVHDLGYALRTFRLNPGFTAVVLGTLALGIGATTTTFSVVDGLLLRPLPWEGAERMVVVRETDDSGRRYFPSWENFRDLRERSRSLDPMVALHPVGGTTVLGSFEAVRVPVMGVTRGFLRALGRDVALGRDFTAAEHEPGGAAVALVGHRFWRDRLGSPERLDGVTVEMRGRIHDVVGVMPPGFHFFREAEVWFPAEPQAPAGRGSHAFWAVGRRVEGATLASAQAELDALMQALSEEHPASMHTDGVWLRSLREELLGEHRRALLLLLGAAGLVLLVACTNVASTLLARGAGREREMAVRSSLGAGRGRLTRQLLTESLVLGGLATAAGVVLAVAGTALVDRLGAGVLPRTGDVAVDGRVLAFSVACGLVASVLFGLVPALRLSAAPARVLRGGPRGAAGTGSGRGLGWSTLVATEVALAVVLLVGSGLLLRSLVTLVRTDTGFDASGVLVAELSIPPGTHRGEDERSAFLAELLDGAGALPGVETAGLVSLLPTDAFTHASPVRPDGQSWDGWNEAGQTWAGYRVADAGYFEALDLGLLAGRLPDPALGPDDPVEAVVNRSLADALWPDVDPVGRTALSSFDPDQAEMTVVGVVEDARLWSVEEGGQPELFVSWRQRPDALAGLALTLRARTPTTDEAGRLARPVRRLVASLEPRAAVRARTLEALVADTRADRRFVVGVLAVFALVGLGLAAAGIYGVVSYTVARRTREIGVRIALGAEPGRVGRSVQATALSWVAAGAVAGLGAAALGARVVEGLLYGVHALDPWTWVGVAALVLASGAVASWIPARRGTRVDPVVALRAE